MYVAPGAISPESHTPLVLVCVTESLLVTATDWPAFTVTDFGENAKLAMLKPPAPAGLLAAGADGEVGAGWAAGAPPEALAGTAPGCTTILRGAFPTGTVAFTERSERPTTVTSLEFSLVT